MIYNLCLHLHGFYVAPALAVAMIFILISIIKEKKDERKRA